jgi:hypothetical protein
MGFGDTYANQRHRDSDGAQQAHYSGADFFF